MLSGGIDSGAVVAVASQLLAEAGDGPLQTVSALGPAADSCVETRAIRASLTLPGVAPNLVDHTELGTYRDDLIRLTQAIAEPFDGHMTLVRAVYIAAHRAGIKVMLDGGGGDVALTASNRVADHLRHLRWRAAWREARGEARFWKEPRHALRSMSAAAWVTFAATRVRDLRRNAVWNAQARKPGKRGTMSRQFADAIDRPARWRLFHSHILTDDLPDSQRRAQSMRHPHLIVGRERYDRVAAALGIEPRDPFIDIRVLQFCLSLPADQLQRDGWPKGILRRAMAGRLPNEVIWRLGKEHLGWAFTQSLFGHWAGWREELCDATRALSRYVDFPNKRGTAHEIAARRVDEKAIELYFLSCWAERNGAFNNDMDSEAESRL